MSDELVSGFFRFIYLPNIIEMKPENKFKSAEAAKGPLREKSFLLAIRIVRLYRFLTEEKKEYVISK